MGCGDPGSSTAFFRVAMYLPLGRLRPISISARPGRLRTLP